MRWGRRNLSPQTRPICTAGNREGVPSGKTSHSTRHGDRPTAGQHGRHHGGSSGNVSMSSTQRSRGASAAGSRQHTLDTRPHVAPTARRCRRPGSHPPASLGASHTWEHGASICGSEGLNSQMGAKKTGSRSPSYLLTQKISSGLPIGGTSTTPPPCQTQVTSWGALSPGGPGLSPALGRVRVH